MSNPSRASVLLFALLAGACTSGSTSKDVEGTPYVPLEDPGEEPIGFFLAQFDKSLARWTELTLNAKNERDQRTLRALERNMSKRAVKREEELVQQVHAGPPMNRQVAAVALGFTGDAAHLTPLMNTLSDPNAAVVQKGLLGLGILGVPETPLAEISDLLVNHPDAWTRNNAAFAAQRIVAAGGGTDELIVACRDALIDEEPGVRAQAASILGMLKDPDSLAALGDILYDEVSLASAASATALSRIGRENPERKGEIARLLVDALDEVEPKRRGHLLRELSLLAGRNLGEESTLWREWAYNMP